MRIVTILAPLGLSVLAGCGLSLQTAVNQTPGILGELEMEKVAIATAPLAGCAMLIQQNQMIMNAMKNGIPAIPINPNTSVPPIITAPSPIPSPVMTTLPPPVVAPPPVPTI